MGCYIEVKNMCILLAEERLDLVETVFSDTSLRTSLQSELRHVPDFHRISRRMASHKASLQV